MFEALKWADVKASEADAFADTLLAEHDIAGARAQLTTLWIEHSSAVFFLDG